MQFAASEYSVVEIGDKYLVVNVSFFNRPLSYDGVPLTFDTLAEAYAVAYDANTESVAMAAHRRNPQAGYYDAC